MARPAEKARAMLNKWTAMRDADSAGGGQRRPSNRRPHLASDCEYLADAERYRNQIVREIEAGVAKIQNPALAEHEIRELNDEINHRMREKWHWNRRVKELGGPDYAAIEKQRQVEEGDDQQQHGGYRYYGAAKDLPGVRELLAKEAAKRKKSKTKPTDIYRRITPDYYGWRDEEDGILLEIEAEMMAEQRERSGDERDKKKRRRRRVATDKDDSSDEEVDDDEDYLAIPTQEEIEKIMLEHKKKALLAKFAL